VRRRALEHALGEPFQLSSRTVDIAVVCSDFAAAVDFYQRQVGLPVHADLEIPNDSPSLRPRATQIPSSTAESRDTLIKLMEIEPAPPAVPDEFRAGVRWLTFHVRDLERNDP